MKRIGLLFPLVLLLPLLAACKDRQAASDVREGADALVELSAPENRPQAETIAAGVKANAAASVSEKQADLPPPSMTRDEILGNPDQYQQRGEKREDENSSSLGLWAWVGGGLVTLMGILRAVPGAHQVLIGPIQWLLENRKDKDARVAERRIAMAGDEIVRRFENLPDDTPLGDVKDKMVKWLPSEAHDEINRRRKTLLTR